MRIMLLAIVVILLALFTHDARPGVATVSAAQGQLATAVPVIRQLSLFDRQGEMTGTLGDLGVYTQPVFSPDGSRIAVILAGDVWIFDIAKDTRIRITSTPEAESSPAWLQDGSQIAYRSTRGNVTAVYRNATNGTISEARVAPVSPTLTDWSRDGRFLLGHYGGTPDVTKGDVFLIPLAGDVRLLTVLATPADEFGARLSQDGRLLAYRSDACRECNTSEVYVRPFSVTGAGQVSVGAPVRASTNGGLVVRWGAGNELFYLSRDGSMMAVAITPTPLSAASPVELFQVPSAFPLTAPPGALVDVSSDGQRFVLLIPVT
jgi:hypothetical protein